MEAWGHHPVQVDVRGAALGQWLFQPEGTQGVCRGVLWGQGDPGQGQREVQREEGRQVGWDQGCVGDGQDQGQSLV